MRVLITGGGGMLARALIEEMGGRHELVVLTSGQLDVTEPAQVGEALREHRPKWVLHAAAYTDVDGAESHVSRAHRVNAVGAGNVAEICGDLGCRMLYFSTDYVFDGLSERPRREWDPLNPINEYGASKAAGEMLVRSLCPLHLIVRTSWLFGPGGSNFVTRILRRAAELPALEVVSDQRGTPTFTNDLAVASRTLLEADRGGVYHVTNSGECSWFDFAVRILEWSAVDCPVAPVPASAFPAPACRPRYSVLENRAWSADGRPLIRSWDAALRDYLGRLDGEST